MTNVHKAYPALGRTGASVNSLRRETTSAQTPDGSSSANPVADQIANNDEISTADSPVSANSTT